MENNTDSVEPKGEEVAVDKVAALVTDFDKLKADLEARKAIPLLVIYGTPDSQGVLLNFMLTDEYERSNDQLKKDVTEVVGKVYEQMKA